MSPVLPVAVWQCPPRSVLVAVDFGDASARALAIGSRLLLLDEPFEGVAPALSERLSEVISGLSGSAISVLIAQSDLNHSKNLLNAEVVIERGANQS